MSSGSGSYPTSPLPPGVPPKGTNSDNATLHQRDSRPDSDVTRTSGISEGSSGSPAAAAESVKIRGHRKRPSASFAPGAIPGQTSSSAASDTAPRARPTSVGLGLSYSKDSTSSSAWSVGSPSMNADSEGEDKRASVPSS